MLSQFFRGRESQLSLNSKSHFKQFYLGEGGGGGGCVCVTSGGLRSGLASQHKLILQMYSSLVKNKTNRYDLTSSCRRPVGVLADCAGIN